ncbi:MAG: alpha/beta hydrolase [Clostridia bacterium]|nr:alpha/beta hydrolase [Clostridia bacterium]
MLTERIYLTDDKRAYLDTYVKDNRSVVCDAMLVLPGGGYSYCSEREAEPVALAFVAKGFNAFVLNYRTGDDDRYPNQLIDASRALLHIKKNAEKYNINPDRVFVVGFSAGGHLAGTLATVDTRPEAYETLGVDKSELTIAGVILSYPVISALMSTHQNSFVRLAGKSYDELNIRERERLSVETHINENSPPAYIWHTSEDKSVPLDGSFAVANKYISLGKPVSLRVYPYGPHGISLANKFTSLGNLALEDPVIEKWIDDVALWITNLRKN